MNVRNRQLLITLAIIALIFIVNWALHHSGSRRAVPVTGMQSSQSLSAALPAEDTTAQCHMHGQLPDPNCTPGETNPNVTQANIKQTICTQGYTATIRPPISYTSKLKKQQMAEYGFHDSLRNHEEDHLISLELGGNPTDPRNLWPEPHASPNPKDKVEDFLHAAVCNGRVSLADAQHRIATDWTTAEQGIAP